MSEIISLSAVREKLANTSKSKSQSKPTIQQVRRGEIPIDEEWRPLFAMYLTVEKARVEPYSTKSRFARFAANEIAIASSEGLISCRLDDGVFTNKWMITAEGIHFLEGMQDDLGSD